MTHQTHHQGLPYCQITFKPAGSRKCRTCWAIKLGDNRYLRAAADGGPWEDSKSEPGVVRKEVIFSIGDVVERPAGVSLMYGVMEVLSPNQE